MIRPLSSPLDLWLIFSLESKGKGFGLVPERSGAWQRACLSLAFLSLAERDFATYIMQGKASGFIQTRKDYKREGAEVVYIAPAPNYDGFSTAIWEALLNYASWRLGGLGVNKLFVDVPEEEEVIFRRAGFSVYAREFLYAVNSLPEGLPEPGNWQPVKPEERHFIVKFYQSITPTPVRQTEGGLTLKRPGFLHKLMVEQKERILKGETEPVAFLITWKEKGSKWIKLFLHPNYQTESPQVVGMALAWAKDNFPPPFTFKVRSYEGAIARGLEEWELPPQRSLSIMVRNTLAMGKVFLQRIPAVP
ncbi:MAG: hypothetical protein RMK30_10270 [Anaerolineae bacterium]|nr:hypothetical protein [Anaerolineae bacterium]MDW8103242.1 hypothetical protein [Anaerolineae bacterium]